MRQRRQGFPSSGYVCVDAQVNFQNCRIRMFKPSYMYEYDVCVALFQVHALTY